MTTTTDPPAQQIASVEQYIARQPLYNISRAILARGLWFLMWILLRLRVHHPERIPQQGATILMINHISALDPVLFTGVVRNRHVITMVKAESMLTYNWLARLILSLWGEFPVRRDKVDRTALEKAIELLRRGRIIQIAPEGTRHPDGLGRPRTGIAYIAAKVDVVIVPAAIINTQDWRERWFKKFRRLHPVITFGEPFRFTIPGDQPLSRELRQQMMREAMYRIAALIPDDHAHLRGEFHDLDNATTDYIEVI